MAPLIRDAVEVARAGSPVSFEVSDRARTVGRRDRCHADQSGAHNLLLNARQAMPGRRRRRGAAENVETIGGAAPSLADGRYVCTTVRDFGCGIPAESLGRIFDPYFTTKQTGNGACGLTTAYAIATRHGGAITVQSEAAGGARSACIFPRRNRSCGSRGAAGDDPAG